MLQDLRDLESDMSAIHRIDDMYAIPAPRFFALAHRLPAYRGAVSARIAINSNDDTGHTTHVQRRAAAGAELTADEVEALRNEHRVRSNPRALHPGEQPQHVPLDQLLAQ